MELAAAAGAASTVRRSTEVFREASGNGDLLRISVAFVGFTLAISGTWIAMMIFAYGEGGATAVAVVGAAQMVPAAVLAPLVATLGDVYRRNRVLVAAYLGQAVTSALTGVAILAGSSLLIVVVLAAGFNVMTTLTRPVQGALLPGLSRTPQELIAANVIAGWGESFSLFAGPLLTGLILAAWSPAAVFLVLAGPLAASTFLVATLRTTPVPRRPMVQLRAVGALRQGFGMPTNDAWSRLALGLLSMQYVLIGALDVIFVVMAVRLLHFGNSGAGFLSAAFGVGALLGALLLSVRITRPELTPPLVAGATAWALGLGSVGAVSLAFLAPLQIGLAGVGRPLFDVSTRTLLQRVVPDHSLSRVFGLLESLSLISLSAGMVLVPLLFAQLGNRTPFLLLGAVLPALVLASRRTLTRIDECCSVSPHALALLRGQSMFFHLPRPTLELLATRLIPVRLPAGASIIRQGEHGDRFYVIAQGHVRATVDDRPIRNEGPGESFGEIALLRDIPRTASVTATTAVELYALERDDFLEAVTGHAQSVEAARAVARERLASGKGSE